MSLKNKSIKKDNFQKGKVTYTGSLYNYHILKSPELFYNSDEFRKIKNRKKGKK